MSLFRKEVGRKQQSLVFEKQDYQEECVSNIINALEKSPDVNSISIKPNYVMNNLYDRKSEENRLDILMETGTGKTYTYIKTIFEIHNKFHKTKFIIVVPRTSIRHSVMQNINQTSDHFYDQYHKRLNCVSYPDDGPDSITNNFLNTRNLSVLLITNSSFNREKNKINSHPETLYGSKTVWNTIVEESPVVIMDEPHLLKGKKTKEYLDKLKSTSLVIRFGATYPEKEDKISNVIYSLNSIKSFREKLVKRIRVDTVSADTEEGGIHVQSTRTREKDCTVQYTVNGQQHEKDIRLGEDLGAMTGISRYNGHTVSRIKSDEIILDNRVRLGVKSYTLTDYEIRQMIRRTIDLHFERERDMFTLHIKTLSLFFIPHVDDFRGSQRIKKIFEEEYVKKRKEVLADNITKEYCEYLNKDYKDDTLCVHEGYFSGDKSGTKEEKEADAVNIILKDKRKLLSLDEPLRFIFSVWALQEGWDNPNVFNICKLAHSSTNNSKRQQVGRGLRIAVDQNGRRMTESRLNEMGSRRGFHEINELNMVVPAYESKFIEEIQEEIHDASPDIVSQKITLDSLKDAGLNDMECSVVFMGLSNNQVIDQKGDRLRPVADFISSNKDKFKPLDEKRLEEIVEILQDTNNIVISSSARRKVNVRPDKWKEFEALWEQLNREAHIVYRGIDEDAIIQEVCRKFCKENIPPVKTTITRKRYDAVQDTIIDEEIIIHEDAEYFQKSGIHENVMNIAKEYKWPVNFLLKLFSHIDIEKFKLNPEKAEELLIPMIKNAIHSTIIEKVGYEFETTIYGNSLQHENQRLIDAIEYTKLGKNLSNKQPPDEFLYDAGPYDSDIELRSIQYDSMRYTEGDITRSVTVFAKLPHIRIPIPNNGTYNPDFAYVVRSGDDKTLFLVVETKGYDSYDKVPEDEKMKIRYGEKFFESLRKVLPDGIDVCFQKRLNRDGMMDMLQRCCPE